MSKKLIVIIDEADLVVTRIPRTENPFSEMETVLKGYLKGTCNLEYIDLVRNENVLFDTDSLFVQADRQVLAYLITVSSDCDYLAFSILQSMIEDVEGCNSENYISVGNGLLDEYTKSEDIDPTDWCLSDYKRADENSSYGWCYICDQFNVYSIEYKDWTEGSCTISYEN